MPVYKKRILKFNPTNYFKQCGLTEVLVTDGQMCLAYSLITTTVAKYKMDLCGLHLPSVHILHTSWRCIYNQSLNLLQRLKCVGFSVQQTL